MEQIKRRSTNELKRNIAKMYLAQLEQGIITQEEYRQLTNQPEEPIAIFSSAMAETTFSR